MSPKLSDFKTLDDFSIQRALTSVKLLLGTVASCKAAYAVMQELYILDGYSIAHYMRSHDPQGCWSMSYTFYGRKNNNDSFSL